MAHNSEDEVACHTDSATQDQAANDGHSPESEWNAWTFYKRREEEKC
jgi:hypothetical protein